jgi:glycerophosphoryl diester phosphodiesterase
MAQRGIHQDFSPIGVNVDSCTAVHISPPENAFIENTIPSMEAAFADGADFVGVDLHVTADGQVAVFHDWTLDCRTNGHGLTNDQRLATLKSLDLGFGYTSDGGKTYPFRGKGVGLLPSLEEVLRAFPGRHFVLQIKSNNPNDGMALSRSLKSVPVADLSHVLVHGDERPMRVLRSQLPGVRTMSPKTLKACVTYVGLDDRICTQRL